MKYSFTPFKNLRFLALFSVLSFLCSHAFGQPTWTSAGTGNWGTPGTWTHSGGASGAAPTTLTGTQSVIITNGHVVTQADNLLLEGSSSLTIQNGGKLIMGTAGNPAPTFTQKDAGNKFIINGGSYESRSPGSGGNLLVENGVVNWQNASLYVSGNYSFLSNVWLTMINVCQRSAQNIEFFGINKSATGADRAIINNVYHIAGISGTGNVTFKDNARIDVTNIRIRTGATSGNAEFLSTFMNGSIFTIQATQKITVSSMTGTTSLDYYCSPTLDPNLNYFTSGPIGGKTSNCTIVNAQTCGGGTTNLYSVSGTVYNDADAGTINGTPTGTAGATPLYASIVNGANAIVSTVLVNNINGTYSFPNLGPGSYTVVLHTTPGGSTTPALPVGWSNTAEGNNNPVSTGDGTPNGQFSVTVTSANLTSHDFGIRANTTTVSGSVWNDASGNAIKDGLEPFIIDGSVFANLVDPATDDVLQSVVVSGTGSYSFSGVALNTNYKVILSSSSQTGNLNLTTSTLPSGWVNTGVNLTGVANTSNKTGVISVNSGAGGLSNQNFGIQQPPTAGSGENPSANPGGTIQVPVPANTFSNLSNSTDPTPGTVTSIRITAFPSGATSIVVNDGTTTTTYTTDGSGGTTIWPVGGVTVPTNSIGEPSNPITVDPTAGVNDIGSVVIPFKAIDNAGYESSNTGTATLFFAPANNPTYDLSGNVFNDTDGPTNINGTGTNAGGLNAILVDNGTGLVVNTVAVSGGGTYTFPALQVGSYSVRITTNPGVNGSLPPSVALPSGWTTVGEDCCDNTGNDGTPDGILTTIVISSAAVTNANFGIQCTACLTFRSVKNGLWNDKTVWEVRQPCATNWVSATVLDVLPQTGNQVLILDTVKQNVDFTVFNCPLILETVSGPNRSSSLIIEPGITLRFNGGINGNAYFNNQPVVVRSTQFGTGAIGEVVANSAINDAENVQLERHLPYSSTPPINKRRWNLLTPGLINGDVMNTNTTLRDAWAGGNKPRVTRSNNRAGSTVYELGNPPGGKPENVPHPLYAPSATALVSNPLTSGYDKDLYTPYTGTIITGNRFTNFVGEPQAADDGFDWWDELIIPQGATFYTSPTSSVVSNATRTTPSSIRPYRPGAASDFGPERGVDWVSNSTINSDPLKGNKSIVELELDELDNGYMIFTRGDRRVLENWVDSTTLRPVGKIRTGNVPFTVNASPALTVLPNPYPAPISLEKLFTDPDNEPKLGLTAHIWNSNFNSPSNNYGGWITLAKIGSSWVSAPATAGNLEIISSSQAFMVEGGTGGPVTFKESMKANLSEVTFLPFETEGSGSSEKAGVLVTNFNNRNSETNALSIIDGAGILLHNKFTSAITDANDVKKVFNFEGGRSLSILRGGTTLVFDAHPDPVGETVFPLQASQLGQSKFAFTFHPTDLEKDGREAWLRDKFLGTETPISLTSVSQYNFEGNADAASIKADRFEIVFKQSEILPVTFTSINAVEQGKNIKVSWNVATEDKMSHYEVEHSTNGTEFGKAVKVDAKNTSPASYNWLHVQPGAGDHFYRVRAFNLEGRSLLTKVVKVTLGDNAPAFKAFPTVVSATRQVTLQLISLEKGSYTLQVSDMTGKVISARTIEHNGGSASMIMQMPASLSAGKYNIRLTGTGGNFVQPVVKD